VDLPGLGASFLGTEKPVRIPDVIEMFLEMGGSGMIPSGTTSLLACSARDDLKREILFG
jgi:hypothetical protein